MDQKSYGDIQQKSYEYLDQKSYVTDQWYSDIGQKSATKQENKIQTTYTETKKGIKLNQLKQEC